MSADTVMFVVKRDGRKEEVSFDKILDRVKKLAEGLEHVNPTLVAQKVCSQIQNEITTSQLDEFAAETATTMSARNHPNYALLAARILVSNHQKNTPDDIARVAHLLDEAGTASSDYYNAAFLGSFDLNPMIDYSRDFLFDYFGFKTLLNGYLLKDKHGKVVERPQHMWMRVAIQLHATPKTPFEKLKSADFDSYDYSLTPDSLQKIKETYDALSLGYFIHATPTLFNSGTRHPQLSSCFLIQMADDSIQGIYKTLGDCAQISKWAGGIGLNIHNIRARGTRIEGTAGNSTGIVPMLKVFNDTAKYVNQGGRRPGSFAIYLEPWHADVEDFLRLKLNQGNEDERARDLFYALWIPDLFMKRVEEKGNWTLMCPRECPGLSDVHGSAFEELYCKYETAGKGRKTIPAQKLWQMILDAQIQTGTPYLLYKDAANAKSNQQNLGTIKSSNLCVASETLILTDKGQFPIKELAGQNARVWNGEVFSDVKILQTGHDQELLNVELSNGSVITCTPYHKFIVSESYTDKKTISDSVRVDAQDLKVGMKLRKFDLPTIVGDSTRDFKYPYTHGFFCGDGTYTQSKRPQLCLYGDKKALVPYLDIRTMSGVEDASGRLNTWLHDDLEEKFKVPVNASLDCRLKWFAGLCDSDGGIARNGTNESIQISSIRYEFLKDVQSMLTGMGVQSKVIQSFGERETMLPDGKGGYRAFKCQPVWRILISSTGLYHLSTLGFTTHRLQWTPRKPQRCAEQFVKVVSVIREGRHDDTYCFNEPLNHAGVFNGILTGNCTEIIEYSSPEETAVCNLGSLSLPKFVKPDGTYDFAALRKYTGILVRNLDIVIDKNFYPTQETQNSNMRHRPIGLGVQGLADVFAKMCLSWTSPEAAQLNREIFENIYFAAMKASMDCAKERISLITHDVQESGAYSTFEGSPLSQGKFQCDLWNDGPLYTNYLAWEDLREKVKFYGVRNSLLVAPMPTASTSQILGNNECFEPFTSNMYVRHVLAGDFIVINKYLVDDLISLGLWTPEMRTDIIANNGSIQSIERIPADIRELYRTAWEIPQKTLINMARDRAPFICQSQSLNLFVAEPTYAKISSMHFYAWKQGLKTGCYYLRTKAVASAQKFTIEPKKEDCLTCSA